MSINKSRNINSLSINLTFINELLIFKNDYFDIYDDLNKIFVIVITIYLLNDWEDWFLNFMIWIFVKLRFWIIEIKFWRNFNKFICFISLYVIYIDYNW